MGQARTRFFILTLLLLVAMPPLIRSAPSGFPAARLDALSTPRTGGLPWGVYQILWNPRRYADQLDRVAETLGATPHFVTFFRDLGRPFPASVCDAIVERGAIPVVSLEIQRWGYRTPDDLAAVADGRFDGFFRTYARDAKKAAYPVLLRFGFEMNGDWFSWGGKPETFKSAWHRARNIFREEGCENVLWVWAPNAVSGPDTPENGFEHYWPGDEAVDVIGLDGYNFGDHHSQWHRWEEVDAVFGPALEKIDASGVRHPILITEFSCAHDGEPARRARWIRRAFEYFEERPAIIGAIWFNYDKRREGEKDWRINADPESLQAWRETFIRGDDS